MQNSWYALWETKYDLIRDGNCRIYPFHSGRTSGILRNCDSNVSTNVKTDRKTGSGIPHSICRSVSAYSMRGRTDIRSGTFRRTSWHRYRLVYDLWNFDHDTWRDRQHDLCLFIFKPSQEKKDT